MDQVLLFTLVLVLLGVHHVDSVCQDLDHTACILMHKQDPHLCQNMALAETACRGFCNLCPVTCYHCDDVHSDAANCTTVKDCAVGERCLLARLTSVDGHHEYKMNCASLERCEGSEYMLLIGRRDLDRRTIATECCSQNLCNNPAYFTTTPATTTTTTTTTTTPAPTTIPKPCIRDIEILVQDSSQMNSVDTTQVKIFLQNLVGRLHLSPNGNNVAVAMFDTGVHNRFDLTGNLTAAYIRISDLNFNHRQNEVDIGNVIKNLDNRHNHDRPQYENVFIFIMNDAATMSSFHTHTSQILQLSSLTNDVIVIGVGSGHLATAFTQLATSPDQVLALPSYSALPVLENHLLSLICS